MPGCGPAGLAGERSGRTVVLHDLLRDFMAAELGDQAPAAHEALLAAYRRAMTAGDKSPGYQTALAKASLGAETKPALAGAALSPEIYLRANAGWPTVPDDGYLYNHLVYHLQAIQAHGEIEALFASPAWLHTRVPADDYRYDGYLAGRDPAGGAVEPRLCSWLL